MILKDLCFEVIKTCPNNCLFCSSCSSPDENEIISFELYKRTIDKFTQLGGIKKLSISGGEPLLHPNIFQMIKYAKDLGITVILFTSGIVRNKKYTEDELTQISDKNNQRYARMMNSEFSGISRKSMEILKQMGLDRIVFDLQSINEDVYNHLMNTRNFLPFVLQSIARSCVVGIPSEIHFIPLKNNINDLNDILDIAQLSVEKVNLLRFIPQGRGRDNIEELMLSEKELADFVKEVKDSDRIGIRKGVHLQIDDTHKCTAGLSKLLIRYDGKILPCAAFKDADDEALKLINLQNLNINNEYDLTFSNTTREKPLCKELRRV